MPCNAVRRRDVDMAPPEPDAALLEIYEHGGLGGVYDHEVGVEGKPRRVLPVYSAVSLPHLAAYGHARTRGTPGGGRRPDPRSHHLRGLRKGQRKADILEK